LGLTLICSCATTGTTLPLAVAVPTVALDNVEVAHYWGYWYISQKTEPTKGKLTANVGAPLDLAFIFAITNPNPFPVQIENMKFTVAFEDFELNTVTAYETMWIPPRQTNQYRVHAMFDVATSFLSLGVTGGFKLEEKKISAWDQLEKWWTEIQTFAFPIQVRNGTASFKVGDKSVISPFTAVYPASAKQ
jgi:hypothetical protein